MKNKTNNAEKKILAKANALGRKYKKEIGQLVETLCSYGGGGKCSVFPFPLKDGTNCVGIALGINGPDENIRIAPVPIEPRSTLVERAVSHLERAGINWETFEPILSKK